MSLLPSPTDVSPGHRPASDPPPCYQYSAQCPQTGRPWQLPRTHEAEAIARGLMQQLTTTPYTSSGNLYGILLVETASGDRTVLKGFSGVLAGKTQIDSWVPPLTITAQVVLAEPHIRERLAHLKDQLMALKHLPVREAHGQISQQYASQLQQLAASHRKRKQSRAIKRTQSHHQLQGEILTKALAQLTLESQQDGTQRRRLKQKRDQALATLAQAIVQADKQINGLKQQYTTLSKQWQTQIQDAYTGQSQGLKLGKLGLESNELSHDSLGRAAAKLLHYAATHHLTPLALAEFWWGQPQGNNYPGQFYGASSKDCQTLMHISRLSNLPQEGRAPATLTMLYQDEVLIVVDKPPGLLSVPGRGYLHQDSVLSRLRRQRPTASFLQAVHRLDQATSGILVLAASAEAHTALGQQFSQRQVSKTYEAILSQPVTMATGTIELPLWGNPQDRPRQSVNAEQGKPSLTHFQVLHSGQHPRVRFVPHTGRTHQLRVHAAHPQGLDAPIMGDVLYGKGDGEQRLHLHATSLKLIHPRTHKPLKFISETPF